MLFHAHVSNAIIMPSYASIEDFVNDLASVHSNVESANERTLLVGDETSTRRHHCL